jgi:hypothetical protein
MYNTIVPNTQRSNPETEKPSNDVNADDSNVAPHAKALSVPYI